MSREPIRTAPLLTYEEAAVIAARAGLHRDKLQAVLLFGSRFSGVRRPKDNPKPIPDVDIAVSIKGRDRQERLNFFDTKTRGWAAFLAQQFGGLPVEIMCTDPDVDEAVVGFLKDSGYRVLWHDPNTGCRCFWMVEEQG